MVAKKKDEEGFEYPELGDPLVLMDVPINKIRVDHSYQRKEEDIDWKRVDNIARTATYTGIGRLLGADRGDGYIYVVDGQHRWLAMQKRNTLEGRLVFEKVAFSVFKSRDVQHEAEVFHIVNNRTPLPRDIRFANGYMRGKEPYVAITHFLASVNVPLVKSSKTRGAISYHTLLRKLWTLDCEASKEAIVTQRVLANGERPFNNYVHRGLWWCATHSVPVVEYAKKLAQMGGIPVILQAMAIQATGVHIGNSDRNCGIGVLNLINHKLRNKYGIPESVYGPNAVQIRRERSPAREHNPDPKTPKD